MFPVPDFETTSRMRPYHSAAPEQLVSPLASQYRNHAEPGQFGLRQAERLTALNLNTARSVLEDGVANAKAVLAAKDPQELLKAAGRPYPADGREGCCLCPQRV